VYAALRRWTPLAFLAAAACSRKTEASAELGLDASPAPTAASAVASAKAAPSASAKNTKDDGCIHVDEATNGGDHLEIDGVLSSGRHSHPNGSSFEFWFVTLPVPRCVVGLAETPTVTEIQLAPKDDKIGAEVKKLVGKKVHVAGDAFPMLTAWHVRPVLISTDRVVAAK
jgi:hypothetical protein